MTYMPPLAFNNRGQQRAQILSGIYERTDFLFRSMPNPLISARHLEIKRPKNIAIFCKRGSAFGCFQNNNSNGVFKLSTKYVDIIIGEHLVLVFELRSPVSVLVRRSR